jgi:enoyl-[acyl-carrier protein] reductase I
MSFLGLENKTIVVFGVANKKSVAYFVGKVLTEQRAQVVLVVQNAEKKETVSKLFPGSDVFDCDVEREEEIARLVPEVARKYPKIDGIVHSIAFADYEGQIRPFHETKKRNFLQAVDISCYSLISISNAFKSMLAQNASVVTISISDSKMAAEPYGFMAPIKAALESSVRFLAKSFSAFSQVRFNSVNSGPLKTSASAGIPGFIDYHLFVEQMTLRKKGVETIEVANAVAFLLSERSSGINAQGIVVDAGMAVNAFDDAIVKKTVRADK